MPTMLRKLVPAAVLLIALTAFAACGDSDDEPAETTATDSEPTAAQTGGAGDVDPAAIEASVLDLLDSDAYAKNLSPEVDCGDEPAPTIDCTISGDEDFEGTVSAAPSQGFQYTGEIEGPDGPSSIGGGSPDADITDPAGVEASLDEALKDNPGEPTADCADEPEGDSLECGISGDGVTGTVTATLIGGSEWHGGIETPEGTRQISGNAIP